MTSLDPRIAIPEPTSTDEAYNQRSLPQYIRAVEAAGGIAVPIPLHESPAAQAGILASCSAILLPGSPADVDPARYGQEAEKECAAKDAAARGSGRSSFAGCVCSGEADPGNLLWVAVVECMAAGLAHTGFAARQITGAVDHQPGREVQKLTRFWSRPGHVSRG